ncbi:hypothetical protein CDL15_Pgr012612 [Punica granatum]|uniref:Uncharacterized protein n=1 Tax=Punica granatum TaxID=22663 RepID=A0A218XXV3_PUNGR|nr:hypothetical protein CDL15_Pgr012612 [Punica granatum]PKI43220.1 hypothetical protein CRG98_036386 [Punica granatum]
MVELGGLDLGGSIHRQEKRDRFSVGKGLGRRPSACLPLKLESEGARSEALQVLFAFLRSHLELVGPGSKCNATGSNATTPTAKEERLEGEGGSRAEVY